MGFVRLGATREVIILVSGLYIVSTESLGEDNHDVLS